MRATRNRVVRNLTAAAALAIAATQPAVALAASGDASASGGDRWEADAYPAESSEGESSGWVTAGAVALSLLYTPVKLTWAVTGATVAGLAWCLSAGDTPAAERIAIPAVYGDYFVLPSHLRRERPFHVAGRLDYGTGGSAAYAQDPPVEDRAPVSSAPWDADEHR